MKKMNLNQPILRKMKLLMAFIFLFAFVVNAQVTEHFTDEPPSATSFTTSGYFFNITGGRFRVIQVPGYGYTGTVTDDNYVDNYGNYPGSAGVLGSFTTSASTFKVSDLYIFPGETGDFVSDNGSVVIKGKLGGLTQFTHTVTNVDINTLGHIDNGWTYVDLSAYSSTSIDELEFAVEGNLRYLAIDAFRHISASFPLPTVTSITPANGSTSGGTSVVITGTNLTGASAVKFGSTSATGYTVNSDTQITATSPAGSGSVNVTVTTAGGTSATSSADQFTYIAAPTVATQAVSSITKTTATGNGSVIATGGANVTERGIYWSTTNGFANGTGTKVSTTGNWSTGAFTQAITGLSSGTTYYVKAFATNYSGTSYGSQVSFTTKAIPSITWSNPVDITYGTLLSATQLNASANTAGTFTYSPTLGTKLNAGNGQTLQVNFTPTDLTNYEATSKTVTINVAKATPEITWSNPTGITYNTLLSATQLNATTDVEGSIIYTPAVGTKLNAGAAQDLKADFTPTDAANFNIATKTVTIDVAKATPEITWSNPEDINNGTALSSVQLNAIANVAGLFTYTPAIGVKLNIGDAQALKADFNPTDAANYESASKTVYINVLLTTGMSEVGTNKFVIFPNPIIDFFSVSGIEGRAKISLSDLSGKVILTKEISNNETISMDNYSRGIYIIKIEDINGFTSMKIVKK